MERRRKMDRTYFYYLRDKNKRPLVTICLHCIGDKYYRGVAICSPKDSPVKRVGRNIAFGRALQAVKKGERKEGLINRPEALDVYLLTSEDNSYFEYNSTDKAILDSFEKKLVKKAGE